MCRSIWTMRMDVDGLKTLDRVSFSSLRWPKYEIVQQKLCIRMHVSSHLDYLSTYNFDSPKNLLSVCLNFTIKIEILQKVAQFRVQNSNLLYLNKLINFYALVFISSMAKKIWSFLKSRTYKNVQQSFTHVVHYCT